MRYQRIVVAIDLSKESEKILNIAAAIAAENHSGLHAVHVIEPMPVYPYEAYIPDMQNVHEQISAESRKQLKEHASRVRIADAHQKILMGSSATEICRYASESDAQLIVLGSHGTSGWRALLGSTANSVVQGAECDVLTVRVGREQTE